MTSPKELEVPRREDLLRALEIREFEHRVLALFAEGSLSGTTHTCLGQEHVPVALSQFQQDRDWVFSNHRGHGHYLARFADPEGLLAELLGLHSGVCHGYGGSQHLYRPGFLSSGVLGQLAPVAVGAAFSVRERSTGGLVWLYTGDGAWGEGAIYEALNMAQLWLVPLIIAVENNGIAQTTITEAAMSGSIEGRCKAFGVEYLGPLGSGIPETISAVRPLVESIRVDPRPLVIEFSVPRLGAHSKGDDTRSATAIREAQQRDLLKAYQNSFPSLFADCAQSAKSRISSAFRGMFP